MHTGTLKCITTETRNWTEYCWRNQTKFTEFNKELERLLYIFLMAMKYMCQLFIIALFFSENFVGNHVGVTTKLKH